MSDPLTAIPNERRRVRLLLALLAALTLAVFAPVCRLAFVDWDDSLHTYQNPYLDPWTPGHLAHFWRGVYKGEYIPVCYMAFAFLGVLGQSRVPLAAPGGAWTVLNPHVFHGANLVLHLLNALLVFALLRRVTRHDVGAFAGALLFAVHPVQVESVAWVSELRGLLSASFGLAALHLYLSYARSASAGTRALALYLGALLLFALALLSKPSAAALPLLALVLDLGVARRPLRQCATSLAGWVALLLPVALLTHGAQPVPPKLHLPLWQRPLVAADALAFYVSKLLLPLRLGIDYGRTPAAVLHSGAMCAISLAAVLLLGLLAWRLRHRQPLLPVALGLFVAALLPVLGFVPFMFQNFSTVADRYLYLALLGPALLVAALAPHCRPAPTAAALGAFLLLCGGLSRAQISTWRDSGALFEHAVAVNPRSPQMHYNLGNFDAERGRAADAIAQYRTAIRLRPDYPQALCNLGAALSDSGRHADAVAPLCAALRLQPDYPTAHLSLGMQRLSAGDLDAARREWRETLRLDPDNAVARYNLACALFQTRPAESAAQFRELLRREPDDPSTLRALRLLARRKV